MRFRVRVAILLCPMLLALWSPVAGATEVEGRLYDYGGGGWKELFPWCGKVGESRMGGNFTDMGGYFRLNVEPGVYTFGFSRRFGLGPVIAPNVTVGETKTTYVTLMAQPPYRTGRSQDQITGHRQYAQGFVSRGEHVCQAWLDNDCPEGTTLVYAIHEGRPNGRQIGPDSADGRWAPGEVRLERGKTYYLTLRRQDDQPFSVYRVAPDANAPAYADGVELIDARLAGRVVADRTGIIVDSFAPEGPFIGPCRKTWGQSFVANGNGLGMVDFTPRIDGRKAGTTYLVRILKGGPGGEQVGPTKTTSGSNFVVWSATGFELRCILWNRGEVDLVPGQEYYIEIETQQEGFQIASHDGALLDGELFQDGTPVPGKCLDAVIIEYEPDDCPPPPVGQVSADLAGSAVQVSFDTPEDMDVNSAAILRSEGGDFKGLAKFYVCPGRTELYVDRATKPNREYTYSVLIFDAAGNNSPAKMATVAVKPITPETNLLVNGDFVSRSRAAGGLCPGWDTASISGGAMWSASKPSPDTPFYTIRAWQKYSLYDVVAYQRVPVTKGTTYALTAQTNRHEPWRNGNVNEVTLIGIDPLGGDDPAADSVVWSAPEYAADKWLAQIVRAKAQSDVITVYLRARAMYGGFGMEAVFGKASLTMAKGGAR
jgi:hypothetical protein